MIMNLFVELSKNAVLTHLWSTTITVSIAILVLLILRPVMKKLPRIGLYLLWMVIVIRIICPISVSGIYSFLPDHVNERVSQTNASINLTSIAKQYELSQIQSKQEVEFSRYQIHSKQETQILTSTTDKEIAGNQSFKKKGNSFFKSISEMTTSQYVVLIWMIGVIVCFAYLVCSLIRNVKAYSDAKHLYDNVYSHPLVHGSFVSGILRPKILVSDDIMSDNLAYVLCHEKVHIKRRDYLIKPFSFLAFSLMWFNPLAWVAYHYMTIDMEVSCDESVIRTMGLAERKEYSYLLLSLTSARSSLNSQNPAFSMGTIKERIYRVMKYRKPTMAMTLALVVIVVLCSCGIASTPKEKTVTSKPQTKENGVYVEQVIDELNDAKLPLDDYDVLANSYDIDAKGNLFTVARLESKKDKDDIGYTIIEYVDGVWQLKDINWSENLMKQLKGKFVDLTDFMMGSDGYLYLRFNEFSMSTMEYSNNPDKYDEDDWYTIHNYLYRVDEKGGTVERMNIKETKKKGNKDKEVYYNSYIVFADGNYMITNYYDFCEIYSGATGEKLYDVDMTRLKASGIMSYPYAGDDFFCFLSTNEKSHEVEAHVYNEKGQYQYSLDTNTKYEDEDYPGISIGVKESTIVVANKEGIFSAEVGDQKFSSVASAKKDNLYYLTDDAYSPFETVFIGDSDDYYIPVIKRDSKNAEIMCHYNQK